MGWPLEEKDLKRYPHFDRPLGREALVRLASSPDEVATHKFFPLLHYEKSWVQFREPGKSRIEQTKTRPIRYAARRDSAIYSRYRAALSELYEKVLAENDLSGVVLAYRRIPKADLRGNKTNIDFARDAFHAVRSLGTCSAVALDVKGFFDNMDHALIKRQWCRLLGVDRLPRDHFKVFSSITRFAWVDRDKLYARLGYITIEQSRGGGLRKKSLIARNQIPLQVCSPEIFRDVVANKTSGTESLLCVNKNGYGIPQGAPISDVIANMYLIDFDIEMKNYVLSRGGFYFRYSDDILVLLPKCATSASDAAEFASSTISKYGSQIRIKPEKTEIVSFALDGQGALTASNEKNAARSDGLEYLGFRFDGKSTYIRNKTLSGVLRKMKMAVRREVRRAVERHPGKDVAFLERQVLREGIFQRFRKVRDFDEKLSKRSWTFYTYIRRAAAIFGIEGKAFYRQVSSQKELLRRFITEEITSTLDGNKQSRLSAGAK
jgi:hypothetical protein